MSLIRVGEDGPVIAETFPATTALAQQVMALPAGDDTRSEFVWMRLANGDLMLGVWPSGDTYCSIENAVAADYARST